MKQAQVHASSYAAPSDSGGSMSLLRRIGGSGRFKAIALVMPLAVFLFVFFAVPLYNVLKTAVVNDVVKVGLPKTSAAISKWDGKSDVPAALQRALLTDVAAGSDDQERLGDAVRQLNADLPGFRSLMSKTQRAVSNADGDLTSVKLAEVDDRWSDLSFWRTIKRDSHVLTANNLLAALDMHRNASGDVESLPEGTSANRLIIGRTFLVAFLVTLVCMLVGVPYALIASKVTGWRRSVMLTMVLIPLWTSLLVRSAAWVVILQDHGVINDALIAVGAITQPIQLIYNRVGVLFEPPRVLWRLQLLREWSHEQEAKQVFPGSPRARSAPGTRAA